MRLAVGAGGACGEAGGAAWLCPAVGRRWLGPMAAVFLVILYEYSPLFYITVVFVCFLVTSGLVLGW